jgi:hypothetical protein
MKFIFFADFFADEILGGGEINNEEIANALRRRGHSVIETRCAHAIAEHVAENWDSCFIVGNFIHMLDEVKEALMQVRYVIYEHDHKYLRSRNPARFANYLAPQSEIINRDFYNSALGVLCQSKFHCDIVHKNLNLDNIKNLGGNAWSDQSLDIIEKLAQKEKADVFSVMNSDIDHKNTAGAVRYCQTAGDYELISSPSYYDFLGQLSKNKKFVFLPRTPETLSRVVVEARMMGVEVHTNNRVGATSEDWFPLKGKELIEVMRQRREEIVDGIEHIFQTGRCTRSTPPSTLPKISLITSLYNGDEHIDDFLRNMTSQSVFEQCELIIIDANSPGNESATIEQYSQAYPNIIYKRLEHDPGIYGCWNEAIEMASGEFISNANLDDRRSLQQLEILAATLRDNPDIDLVYSQCFVTQRPNEEYSNNSSGGIVYPVVDFTPENMIKCLPGCMPIWRKSMHETSGLFDSKYKFAGDWEMWLRAVKAGSRFKRVLGVHGLYYHNPKGLTTDALRQKDKFEEEKIVFHEYADIFGQANYEAHGEYFSQ